MNKETQTKLFAFKLAAKTQEQSSKSKWTAREGVSVAGCSYSGYGPEGLQYTRNGRRDSGAFC